MRGATKEIARYPLSKLNYDAIMPHKPVKMHSTICAVTVIIKLKLGSSVSSTKRVITHVTIKPLAGILANNYAVMKSVKILTAERGAYIKLLSSFSLQLSYK